MFIVRKLYIMIINYIFRLYYTDLVNPGKRVAKKMKRHIIHILKVPLI